MAQLLPGEQEMGPDGQTSFVKRDGYESVAKLVNGQRSGHLSVSSIDLFHEPGSGGTTLAMQVLWDFRKKLRCAVLRDSEAKAQDVARQAIALFHAGEKQNTVLLLINDLPRMETLRRDLMECVPSSRVGGNIPVVIVLNCMRISGDSRIRNGVTLRTTLSEEEQNQFVEKEAQVRLLHGEQSKGFYGLNLMRHNFSREYVQSVIDPVKEGFQPAAPNTQLLSFLALLNFLRTRLLFVEIRVPGIPWTPCAH
ncbi:hypothetical protein AAFF_G00323700 [Aldrovandia affinis]|uniref:Uncharacterized protein n=1 Tax=Aldrovandia affinis TaxID=143900 RepID=A0AAD7W0N2_9TELE|nr:hypothetical protein AAFF_G00323700 [Aldrovandia affinis]